jgi:hypothetical protein
MASPLRLEVSILMQTKNVLRAFAGALFSPATHFFSLAQRIHKTNYVPIDSEVHDIGGWQATIEEEKTSLASTTADLEKFSGHMKEFFVVAAVPFL